jgi:hypothetical protein
VRKIGVAPQFGEIPYAVLYVCRRALSCSLLKEARLDFNTKKMIVSFASFDPVIAHPFLSPRGKDDREYVGYSQSDKNKDDNSGQKTIFSLCQRQVVDSQQES